MNSEDVTHAQAVALARWLAPATLKLLSLRQRMKAKGFPKDDPLYARVAEAYEAVRLLRLAVRSKEPIAGMSGLACEKPGGYPKPPAFPPHAPVKGVS